MANLSSDDYYKILGVAKNATDTDIKKAYRKLAIKFHPDKNPDDPKNAEDNFKKINEAYDILSDSTKRAQYDQFGKGGMNGPTGGMSTEFANDIFRNFFQGGGFGQMGMESFGNQDRTNVFMNGVPICGGNIFETMFSDFANGAPFGGFNMKQSSQSPSMRRHDRKSQHSGNENNRTDRPDIIKNDTHIVTKNLKTVPELNGIPGRVHGYNSFTKRYIVKLKNKSEPTSLKIDNIQIVAKCYLYFNNIKYSGHIIGFDSENNKYNILYNKKVSLFPINDVIIENNTFIRIINIQSDIRVNGTCGIIESFDAVSKKYIVNIVGNRKLKVGTNNVLCC